MSRPQTIQIFLPDGSPTSIREAEITNRLVKAILFPRNKMQEVAKRELVHFTGVYFLFGLKENEAPLVYIGEGEECFDRIKEHHRLKDFWTHCVVVITKTNEYTKTEGKFLEHYCLKKAAEIGRYLIENSNSSKEPSIPESRKYDLLDNFETIKILLATLGFPIFEEGIKSTKLNIDEFYIKFKGLVAKGIYNDEGFVILKGSEARKETAGSFRATQKAFRQKLIEFNIIASKSDRLVFLHDYIFPTPSAASDIIKGNSSNGWVEWKDKDGKTLDEIKRK
ncbi:hypothetical protein GCM10011531_00760 [Aquaticitalea lipolytica]|uniref:DUF4357 domain-containing protein n=1 Tax=Aquaticitalea lipolytica TaxID=1247562 RepID=A0A8J2XE20_9FLAO|nr:GIY-YIG nuclease family protein [Aquaticitalea lipolytica]GFZ76006.1 hypothetical protein GCM10011531_00760 [Aquaticitalea lipolytica]